MKTQKLFILLLTSLIFSSYSYGQMVVPQEQNGKLFFQVANIYFEVDPSYGARISSLKIDDQEILYVTHSGNNYLWGSTLWQSPQSEWGWPPSVMLDQDPYAGGIVGNEIILKSDVDVTYSHLRFKKIFSANLADTSISIEYTMINEGSDANSFSAWEVARVASGGLSLFPIGEGDVEGAFATQTEIIDNIVWYEQESSDPGGQKFFCDGSEGWSAHVNDSAKLFIKKFSNASAGNNAPGEQEIELYYSGPTGYIELENQSEYKSIAVGDSVSWNMKWYARNIPPGITIEKGSNDLLNYVRSVANIVTSDKYVSREPEINIYPNPASGYIILTNLPADNVDLNIYDICGKFVFSKNISNNEYVELKGIMSGIYIYQINTQNLIRTGKVIIKN